MKLFIANLFIILSLFGCAHLYGGHSRQKLQMMMTNDVATISFAMIIYSHQNGAWPSSLSDLRTHFSNLAEGDDKNNKTVLETIAVLDTIEELSITMIDKEEICFTYNSDKLYEASTNLKVNQKTNTVDNSYYSLSLNTNTTYYGYKKSKSSEEDTQGQKIGATIIEIIAELLKAYSKYPF